LAALLLARPSFAAAADAATNPLPSVVPVTPEIAAPQQPDPEAPPPSARVPAWSSAAPTARSHGGGLFAGQIAAGVLTAGAFGVGGAYALPRNFDLGVATLLLGPIVAAGVVCGVGHLGSEDRGCGQAIGIGAGGAAVGTLVALLITAPPHSRPCESDAGVPESCTEFGSPSPVALIVGYAVGAAAGAVVGWSIAKRRNRPVAGLQPALRAAPRSVAMSEWFGPTPTIVRTPLIAFSF
jgi:hypothetical protein